MKYLLILAVFAFSYSLQSVANDNKIELAEDEGLAIVAIYSKGYAEKIVLNGNGLGNNHEFGPLDYSQHFSVYKLKAGKYSWDKVVKNIAQYKKSEEYSSEQALQKSGRNIYQTSDLEQFNLSFEISPGKLNYTGLLMFETTGSYFSAKILNRTSIILAMLKQDFPQYLKNYEIVNAIYPNDPYIPFYLNGEKAIKQGE